MEVGIAEARNRLSELIDRAERGEAVTITRHGRAAATLNAARQKPSRSEIEAVLAEIAADRAKLPPISTDEVLSAIKADRRE